jgi:hypothetical protein
MATAARIVADMTSLSAAKTTALVVGGGLIGGTLGFLLGFPLGYLRDLLPAANVVKVV